MPLRRNPALFYPQMAWDQLIGKWELEKSFCCRNFNLRANIYCFLSFDICTQAARIYAKVNFHSKRDYN